MIPIRLGLSLLVALLSVSPAFAQVITPSSGGGGLSDATFNAAFGTAGTPDSQVLSVQGITSMTPLQVQSNAANLATEATLGNVLTSANFAAAFGTAGAADSQVMSVQGIASMTPLLANPGTAANWGVQTQGSTTSGQSGLLIQGAVTTAAPTYTTGQTSPLSLTTAGELRVTGGGGGTQYAVDAALGATPTGTLAIAIRDDALSALTPIEGDAIGLRVDSIGALWTRDRWLTPLGQELVDDVADALRTTVTTVVTTQGKTHSNKTWYIADADGAQTNLALVSVTSPTIIRVSALAVACSNANTADVSVQIGFGATVVPARAVGGAAGVLIDHPKVPKGGGIVRYYHTAIEGAAGEDLRLTMDDPVGGACSVTVESESI